MQILFITEFFPEDTTRRFTGGVEARTFYLVKELRKHHSVTVISRSRRLVAANLLSLPARIVFILKAVFQGLKTTADLVEGSNFISYLPAFIVAKLKHIPAVAWYPDVFIGTWVERFGAVGIFGELAERLSLKLQWDSFIALSGQTRQKLMKQGVDPLKITVIYGGVETQEFTTVKTKKHRELTIVSVSRLVRYKNMGILIDAFARIREAVPRARLVIIGEGPQEKWLRSEAKRIGVAGSIIWEKRLSRDELIRTLKSAHVFCLPSLSEGFGLVTLEAVAAGLPFVNADIAINREVAHEGKGGLLFAPHSALDLSDKILKLWNNSDLYHQKLNEGKALVKLYSWRKAARETMRLYQRVLR